jgi:mannose-6-phosphate isomerase-like protein (cupin superfamily)
MEVDELQRFVQLNLLSRKSLYMFVHYYSSLSKTLTSSKNFTYNSRSGWVAPKDVKKDDQGMEDEGLYFDVVANDEAPPSKATIKTPKGAVSSSSRAGASATKVSAAAAFDYDADQGDYDDDFNFPDGQEHLPASASSSSSSAAVPKSIRAGAATKKSSLKSSAAATKSSRAVVSSRVVEEEEEEERNEEEEEEEEQEVRTAPKPKKKIVSSEPPKKVARIAEPKQKTVSAASRREAALLDDQNDDIDEDQFVSPGGSDMRRKRPSLGTASLDRRDNGGSRHSLRRRWAPLDHWKGERVKYRETEDGEAIEAVAAERLGVLSPKVEGLYKKRAQSTSQGGKPRSISRGRESKKSGKASMIEDEDNNDEQEDEEREQVRTSKGGSSITKQHGPSAAMIEAAFFKDKDRLRARPEVQALIKEAIRNPVYIAGRGSKNQASLPASELPSSFAESERPNLIVHGTDGVPSHQIQVLRKSAQLAYERLPSTDKSKTHPGFAMAAAAFDAPQFISGTVRLTPRSVKELESTHNCTQAFVVLTAQPRSIQVDIGTQSYLVSPGDHFFVPENCDYRLTNHSKDTVSEIAFVVIKPRADESVRSPK